MVMVFLMVVFSVSFVFENLSRDSVTLKLNRLESENLDLVGNGSSEYGGVEYGDVPIFAENLRFNHNLISYSIDGGCGSVRKKGMIAAFNIFSSEVGIISFYEASINDSSGADIKVGCSNEFIELGGDLFAAGEGGPSRIINTSGFKVVEEGKIKLYDDGNCDYPIVPLHELAHVFGFDHSPNPKNIMYNTSACDQRMSKDMIDFIRDIYSIEALSNVRVESISGFIEGKYLHFNISVLNEGLIGIENTSLTILGDGEEVGFINLGEIDIGYGRTLKVDNMRLNGKVSKLEFIVDAEELVRETNEDDNVAVMIVS